MYNINKHTIKDIIKQELKLFQDSTLDYWGSETQIKNEIEILNFTKCEMSENESIEEYYTRLLKKY